MKDPRILDRIVEAVLYEGYILYPYRASAKKNFQRFTFGRVYPTDYSQAQHGAEPCTMQTECLVRGVSTKPAVAIRVRFLHPMWREVWLRRPGSEEFTIVPQHLSGDRLLQTWQESVEREVTTAHISLDAPHPAEQETVFHFPASETVEPVDENVRLRRHQEALDGTIRIASQAVGESAWKLRVTVANLTPVPAELLDDQDEILMCTFASTHTILHADGAEFISLLETPPEYADAANQCRNLGTWPVLVGDAAAGERDTLLSSPIILYDYPQIAPESPGTLFDGAEIDEILTLRIRTMTDDEKRQARSLDEHARRLLERTESLSEDHLLRLHGVLREVPSGMDRAPSTSDADTFLDASPIVAGLPPEHAIWGANKQLDGVTVRGSWITAGDHVRIHPKRRADAIDLFLNGKTALVEAVEQDAEGAVHLALVLEEDPGKDLGMMRQPGHRFFYTSDEVEPIHEGT
jgi:hydrogenase maturation protease